MKSDSLPPSTVIFLVYLFCNTSSIGAFLSDNDISLFSPASTLRFVALVSRHGSRTPLSTFPTDPYPYTDRRFWPGGPTELTNLGKVQLYKSGITIRTRYNGFLNAFYSTNETVLMYNPYNRDYMSAACLAASLYPPVGNQVWNPALMWQPVILSQRDFDVCDLSFNNMCPKYMKIFDGQVKKFNEDTEKHKDLLKYISDQTGRSYSNLSQLYDVYDTLLMQAENGYKLPQWTKTVFPFILRPFAVSYLIDAYAGTYEQIQLSAGPELKYISDMLNAKANGKVDTEKKMYVEVAHDCTLIALLRAMGNRENNLEIHTGSYIVLELHYMQPNYIVQTFYFRNSDDHDPIVLNIADCPNPCSLTNFNNFVNKINPPDYGTACQV